MLNMAAFFSVVLNAITVVLLIPIITMRIIAEENRQIIFSEVCVHEEKNNI